MQSKRKSTSQRIVLVGAIGAVALIGNMRATGSQDAGPWNAPRSAHSGTAGIPVAGHGTGDIGARQSGGVPPDDAQLIPAIYAWDPDVRFVYFRHVSKWM